MFHKTRVTIRFRAKKPSSQTTRSAERRSVSGHVIANFLGWAVYHIFNNAYLHTSNTRGTARPIPQKHLIALWEITHTSFICKLLSCWAHISWSRTLRSPLASLTDCKALARRFNSYTKKWKQRMQSTQTAKRSTGLCFKCQLFNLLRGWLFGIFISTCLAKPSLPHWGRTSFFGNYSNFFTGTDVWVLEHNLK